MTIPVPSLSTQGWLTTIGEKADRLLSYFFTNEYSQSVIFYRSISSLPYLVANFKNQPDDLRRSIDDSLSSLLSSFFEQTDITVSVKSDNDSNTKYTIEVSAQIIDENDFFELARVVHIKDSTIVKIVKILNG